MIERHWSWRVWRYFRVLSNERHCRSIECVKAFRREFQLKQKHNQVTQLVQQFEGFSTFEGKSTTWALEIEQNNFTPFHQNKLAEFVLVSTANGGFLLFRWPFPSCAIVYRVFAIELFGFFSEYCIILFGFSSTDPEGNCRTWSRFRFPGHSLCIATSRQFTF